MHYGQAFLFFILGTFLGPWILSMFTGKSRQAA